jgi:hypothetical protein
MKPPGPRTPRVAPSPGPEAPSRSRSLSTRPRSVRTASLSLGGLDSGSSLPAPVHMRELLGLNQALREFIPKHHNAWIHSRH